MPSPLDLRLHELSGIICTSSDAGRVNAAAFEHRSLCRLHTVMPAASDRKTVADVEAGVTVVLDVVRELYAASGAPVPLAEIAGAAGVTTLYAGIYVRKLVDAGHVRTIRNARERTFAIPL